MKMQFCPMQDDMFALVLLINQGRSESEIKKTEGCHSEDD